MSRIYRYHKYFSTTNSTPSLCQKNKLYASYLNMIDKCGLKMDDDQVRIIQNYLDPLSQRLQNYHLPTSDTTKSITTVPRGLYLYGDVGTGKSMLMKLFYNHVNMKHKRRIHFNTFMLEVHSRLQQQRIMMQNEIQIETPKEDLNKPLTIANAFHISPSSPSAFDRVAEEMTRGCHLLCLDEFQITDIADAMLIMRLCQVFFTRGVVLVATSNVPPDQLYQDGLHRDYILPFLTTLKQYTKVRAMKSTTDYREIAEQSSSKTYFSPTCQSNVHREYLDLKRELSRFSDSSDPLSNLEILNVPVGLGREITVSYYREASICFTSFTDLCLKERGVTDYKTLCKYFASIVVEGVPIFHMDKKKDLNAAKRFILLIDELYECQTRFICTAEAPIQELFVWPSSSNSTKAKQVVHTEHPDANIPKFSSWDTPSGGHYNPGASINTDPVVSNFDTNYTSALQDLKVAHKRAISRLFEMQSHVYQMESLLNQDQCIKRLHQLINKD